MSTTTEPLDELQWRDQNAIQELGGGVHENTVLHYFARSPFFDPVSNNAIIATQAFSNPDLFYQIETRAAFEQALARLSGLEYIVVEGPKNFGPEAPIGEGRWVIRKQNRRKRPGAPDEITVQGTYFIIGENIYAAPTVDDVLWAKMLSASLNINNFLSTAATLPLFSASTGHHYLPTATKPTSQNIRAGSMIPSRVGSPAREQSPGVLSLDGAPHPNAPRSSTSDQKYQSDLQAMYESLGQFSRYRNEYMDETPLIGEPGHFSFAARKPPTKLPPKQSSPAAKAESPMQLNNPTVLPDRKSTPVQGSVQVKLEEGTADMRPSKPKRKKSRAPTSPSSPASNPASPISPSSPQSAG